MIDLDLQLFAVMIEQNNVLEVSEKAEQVDFVYTIIKIMAKQSGGFGYFWRDEDEDFIFSGWVEGLISFKPTQILNAVDLVLNGYYKKYESVVPKTVMDFKEFMKNGSHAQLGVPRGMKSVYKIENIPKPLIECEKNKNEESKCEEKTQEIYQDSMECIRIVLKGAKSSHLQKRENL